MSQRDYDSAIGQRIGPYKILELLGEGGMGEVYLAEQTVEVRRQVALKVIKLGMDSKQVLARFEAERQALALMDHPHIAKALDAGTTEDGRPYFAMEYVKGIPLTDYCDLHRVPTAQRIELFIKLCDAVQHAHQKGVIHRDLKPSNVLVTVPAGDPAPQVIDFGIAKAIGYSLTERTLHTEIGRPIGTPAYMSPEQAEATGLDVDTRTDVYTLGVMLYELLVGELPLEMKGIPPTAVQLTIRETDPEKPSTRYGSMGEARKRVAELRRTSPAALRSELKGDLDWIVMKAMEKDRTRRYDTVNALALDLQRHLDDEPVTAGSPSAAYRMRKFARRHRVGVAATAAIALGIIGGSVLATVGMLRAREAERLAEAEAAAAQEVADFLVGLFEFSDPGQARGDEITAREILDQGAERIQTELGGQPITQARLMTTMGEVYYHLGLHNESQLLFQQALTIREERLGSKHLDVARSLANVGTAYILKGDYAEAEESYLRSLEIMEEVPNPDSERVATMLSNLGGLYQHQGRYEEAAEVLRRAIVVSEQELEPGNTLLARGLNNLGVIYFIEGRYTDAEPLWRRALETWERAEGPDHPEALRILSNLGLLYISTGDHEKAESFLQRSLEMRLRVLGPDHPDVGRDYANLAQAYQVQEKYDEAEPLFARALEITEAALGVEHSYVGKLLYFLSQARAGQERHQEAEALALRALANLEPALGPEHSDVGYAKELLARIYTEQGRFEEAERLYREALAILESAFGPDGNHPDVADALEGYSSLLAQLGRNDEADSLTARAEAIRADRQSEE